jgi:hypothetical protein
MHLSYFKGLDNTTCAAHEVYMIEEYILCVSRLKILN